MERPSVTAVTHADEARVTLTGVRDEPGVAAQIFGALADANVNVDMIIQNEPVSGRPEGRPLVHGRPATTCSGRDRGARRGSRSASGSRPTSGSARSRSSAPGCAATPASPRKVFQTLGENGINIEMISTSPIKISCVIAADEVPDGGQGAAPGVRAGRRTRSAARSRPGEHRPARRPDEDAGRDRR